MSEERGVIQFRNRKKQIVDFSGLQYGTITPTDIDGSLDIKATLWVFYEFKYRDAPMKLGQSKHFMYTADALVDTPPGKKRYAIVLVCRHNIDNPEDDIPAAKCYVDRYRWKGKWRTPLKPITAKEATDKIIALTMPEKAKELGLIKEIA